jgi:hypothetical protein
MEYQLQPTIARALIYLSQILIFSSGWRQIKVCNPTVVATCVQIVDILSLHIVSENFEPAETEAHHSDGAFQGTFLNPHNSFDMNDFVVFEETQALEATSTTEGMSVGLAGQQNSPLGL